MSNEPVKNDVSILASEVVNNLVTLRELLDELMAGGVIEQEGRFVQAFDSIATYCGISLEMLKRTPV